MELPPDYDNQTAPEPPPLPPLRTFIVQRYRPDEDLDHDSGRRETEKVQVLAHYLKPVGDVLEAYEVIAWGAQGPMVVVREGFNGWIDYREVDYARLTPDVSRIIH